MRCIYCLQTVGPFTNEEHIIAESLGNSDDILPPGFVCDPCNEHFGSNVEEPALRAMPFAVARISAGVPNKRGRVPELSLHDGIRVASTGLFDVVEVTAGKERVKIDPFTGRPFLPRRIDPARDRALARMLVKIGLGLVALSSPTYDVFDERFNLARRFARESPYGMRWEWAQGDRPSPEKLIVRVRLDPNGLPVTDHQLYTWELRTERGGDELLVFQYRSHAFFTYLTRSTLGDFIARHRDRFDFLLIGRSGGSGPAS